MLRARQFRVHRKFQRKPHLDIRGAEILSCKVRTAAEFFLDQIQFVVDMLALEGGCWRLNPDGWLLFNTLLSHFH